MERWTLYRYQIQKQQMFGMKHLHTITNIKWCGHISIEVILKKAFLENIHRVQLQITIHCTGNSVRMGNTRLPKQMLFSQLADGIWERGRPKLRVGDTVKINLKDLFDTTKDLYQSPMMESSYSWEISHHWKQ